MKIRFLKKFSKDLDKIMQPKDKKAILRIIEEVQLHESFDKIPNTKKLIGFPNAYRIRIGNMRIGVFIDDGIVEFARIAFRKDIYKIFP